MLHGHIHGRWKNNVCGLKARHLKIFGKDAENPHRMIVEINRPVQDSWIAIVAA